MSELTVTHTDIPGLLVLNLPLHEDPRGWFKENWQRARMLDVGLPDFGPVQNNMSFNSEAGVTRGIHAEPWDKLVSVGVGRVFGAWVDLRPGDTFGKVFTAEVTPRTAVFVPRGVANAFQTLDPGTLYSYLVNDHWSAQAKTEYTFVNLADPVLAIRWPIPLDNAIISEADKNHPVLKNVSPMPPRRTLVLGSNGQLGRALRATYVDDSTVEFLTRKDVDLADPNSVQSLDLNGVSTVINAAAYTQVDAAETELGREKAWATNAAGVAHLALKCSQANVTLVHISSDYVFSGSKAEPTTEDAPLSPLGVYGQTKAAGDLAVSVVPRHYIIRTSWVVGGGRNFVSTMADLAKRNISPDVVNDQSGRLTSTATIASAIHHILSTKAEYGIYNVTGSGEPKSWSDIASQVFALCGRLPSEVNPVSSEFYNRNKQLTRRPANSSLDLSKITATGFAPDNHLTYIQDMLDRG